MPLQESAPRTLAKQGDGKDKAMAMDPGADHKCDNKLNANLPCARSRGKGQRSVEVASRVETDFRCGSRKYSTQVEKFGRDRKDRRRTLKNGVGSSCPFIKSTWRAQRDSRCTEFVT